MFRSFCEFVSQKLGKPWAAKKDEIVRFWSQLPPGQPLKMRPISEADKGTHSHFHNDTIRITGTPEFINSVMSHLKAVLALEMPGTKLEIEYRQTESSVLKDKPSYVLYVKLFQQ